MLLNEEKKESLSCHDIHVMTCHDTCHEVINNTSICHDIKEDVNNFSGDVNNSLLSKSDWLYLTRVLDSWRVYNARSVCKKNPVLAWQVMNLCKDPAIRVKGAYFTAVFRDRLEKFKAEEAQKKRTQEEQKEFEAKKEEIKAIFQAGRQRLGIA